MKQKEIFLLVIPTFLFVVFWIIFSVVHNANSSTISQAQTQTIQPITPTFDQATIANLKKRTPVEPVYALATTPPPEQPHLSTPSAVTPFPIPTATQPQSTPAVSVVPSESAGGGIIQ